MNTLLALSIIILFFGLLVVSYYVHMNQRMTAEEKRAMQLTIVVCTLAAFTNLFSTMMDGNAAAGCFVHGLCKALEHSLGPVALISSARIVRRDKMGTYLGCLFCLNAIIQFFSIRTGWAFTIDADNVYHSGYLNIVTRICSLLASLYLIYSYYRFSRTYRNRNAVVLLMIMAMIWIAVIAHILVPELEMMYVSSMLSVILIYIYLDDFKKQIQSEEISRQMSIMDTLTVNFECVYKVNLSTHYFKALRVSDYIGRQLGGKLSPDTKYETGMELYCDLNVYGEDKEMFRENTKLDAIVERLKDEKSYSFGYRILRNDKIMFFNMSAYKILEGDRLTSLLIGFADVDEQRKRWENLMKISTTDQMTGALNRRAYAEELERIDRLSASEKSLTEAVVIDLNGLKKINDTYGHKAGDELIVGACSIMKKIYGKTGNIYRMGGDEFVIITTLQKQDSRQYVSNLKNAMAEWKGINIDSMSASVGTARIDEAEPGTPMEEVVKFADAKMYKEKAEYYKLHDRRAGGTVPHDGALRN